jgi:glutamate racemase
MKIGVFDSGYGGLTVLREFMKMLPQYDYVYLGDNARTPYGTRSYETVYRYTLQAVKKLFELDAKLVILACNTASAKALRSIQQNDLENIAPDRRVLGVIRPSVEALGRYTKSGNVGIFGTPGTVASDSYVLEIAKLYPKMRVYQQACPMWVPLVENNEHLGDGADYFVKKCINHLLRKSNKIDTVILACTHYPLLLPKIRKYLPGYIKILSQGEIVAPSLKDYLFRHPEIEQDLSKNFNVDFFTTDIPEQFSQKAQIFLENLIVPNVKKIELG